ncbi:FlgN protein [Natronincola peptidivorans]|uniref:FlgN protein n=1 Tax=Natronincola peptidivorans TaxID=426128 RepID=A0A1H9ZQZ3_9FIRM|nr:flagellar protein FlgN [Natronincola peptidivorans]SES84218.1 FlgN protein [Natronincola peptidivorans]
MVKSIEQLRDALQKELKMYKDILEMSKEKTVIIKLGKLKELEETTQKEQQYIRTMGTFEKIRRSIFVNIAEEMEIPEPASLSELLLHLEDEEAEELDAIRDELLASIKRLTEVNQLNEKLIEQNLEYVNFNLELMTSSTDTGNNYGEQDTGKKKSISSILDIKV